MIIALNNKSNLTKESYQKYQQELSRIKTTNQLILCPSTIHLADTNLDTCLLGGQNVSKNDMGAHTGEVTSSQLKSYNVRYCIVGHSERRQELNENNEDINLKIKNLYQENIIPILCIGETKEERDKKMEKEILLQEITTAIKDLTIEEKEKLIVAYEPIWSIGTGIIPNNNQIEEIFSFIKEILPTSKLLYGGSANENNIDELQRCTLIDGYLLGGLSLQPEKLQIFLKKLEN